MGSIPILQYPLDSKVQVSEQPSEIFKFPSSHISSFALTPSPQTIEHTLGVAVVQEYPCSITQRDEQPSLLLMFPSSHYSVEFFTPLPQVFKQTEGSPEQEYPALIVLKFEHPSVSFVFPSSQDSVPTIKPSIFFGVHESGVETVPPEHIHVESTDIQSDAHPSPSSRVPSSQISGGFQIEFPQISQRFGLTKVSQFE